jgi:hypothetical protein
MHLFFFAIRGADGQRLVILRLRARGRTTSRTGGRRCCAIWFLCFAAQRLALITTFALDRSPQRKLV